MRLRLWPRSLAARTAILLLAGLVAAQAAGLGIEAIGRAGLQRLEQGRHLALRVMELYITVAKTPPAQRATALRELRLPAGITAQLDSEPPARMLVSPLPVQQLVRLNMALVPLPPALRPAEVVLLGSPAQEQMMIGLRLPDDPTQPDDPTLTRRQWLNVTAVLPAPRPWQDPDLLAAFLLMSAVAAALTGWAVVRLSAPVATLTAAADRLGEDVNAAPLPEVGPSEVTAAAAAFNRMAARLRRFVQDRTLLLAAIGHDLRTPITRLRLRAEFVADDELRARMLADLDDLEALVTATLAFGRTATSREPAAPLDLAVLARTLLDEAADARPELAERLVYDGPEHLTVRARSTALKRALGNLVANAIAYGGSARIRLLPPEVAGAPVRIEIEDDGPGLPPGETEQLFDPFRRGEESRSRETGGVGLGLTIARDILRAHGGEVTLANRGEGGARASVRLPA